jgi:hypothetical protein
MNHFKPSTHQYIIQGKPYKSFSSIIKLVEPEKDWDDIAAKYAKKHSTKKDPLTVEDVKKQWAEKGRIARERGTLFHALKEEEDINSKDKPVYFSETINDIKPIRNLETLEDGIYPELTLYNNEYQACGTADKVIIETINGVRYIDILDYKTSETIDEESYYDARNQKFAMLANPLQSVMDCNFMKYSLQLSMYAFFLEKYNFTPRNLILIHLIINELDLNKESKYKIEYEGKSFHVEHEIEYPVKYMKKEVKALLQYHKSKIK